MKISPISAVNVKKVKAQKNTTNPVNTAINNAQYDANKMFGIYFGKDLISFKANNFQQTLKDNYFQLPAGCTPDEFQVDAGEALLAGKDVLVEAPTGTGKTAIAHYAATKNMHEGKTTFYTTPLKALSNQKLNEFRAVYGEENVGILTGDRRENVEAPIIIMTTEVYRNMALSHFYGDENPLMQNLGTVIFDEFHYLGDPDRGPVWEESVMYTPSDVQTLELSATIGNPKELEKWIGDLKGNNVHLVSIPSEARHVPLEFDMIETQSYSKAEKKIQKAIKRGETPDDGEGRVSKPKLSDFKAVIGQLKQKEQLPAILFIFSRNYSRELLEYLSKEGSDLTTTEEKEQIDKIVDKYTSKKYIGADLDIEALRKGYAIHNAGIIPGQKELIEELFQKKLLKTVIATETLAAGINMPAKTVVISSPYKPCDADTDAGKLLNEDDIKYEHNDESEENSVPVRLLTSNEFKQMAGRAGRRGIDTVGYVYTMPTDRSTEQDFLYLEATDCNPINSNFNPDYSFIAGYYEHNNDDSKLGEIYKKTFYVNGNNKSQNDAKMSELTEISDRKSQILLERGFLEIDDDGNVQTTFLGNMAAKVRGYDALTLSELINSGVLNEITPQTLAMIAASIAIPSNSDEGTLGYETDISGVFSRTKDSLSNVSQKLVGSVTSMLGKFGKTFDDFSSYDEMLEFAKKIEKPDVSEAEIKQAMSKLEARRAKMYKITKTTGNISVQDLVDALKHGETVPTKYLESHLDSVEKYKKKINSRTITDYIEKLESELSELDTTSKGNKAKARIERQQKELTSSIQTAKHMQFLEANIPDALASNYQFIRKNPPEQVKQDFRSLEKTYIKLTTKDALINKIKALKGFEESCGDEVEYDITAIVNERKANTVFKNLLKTSLDIYNTEISNGINAVAPKYNTNAAQMLYAWTSLNQANTEDTMTNWAQLVRMTPDSVADEGTIYRNIMQTADLLSQIGEMAQVGIEQTDEAYYKELKETAMQARELLIKEPITI